MSDEANWHEVRASVAALMNAADPMNVLDDAPPDEYDPEITPLTRLVLRDAVTYEAAQALMDDMFGPPPPGASRQWLIDLVTDLQRIAGEVRASRSELTTAASDGETGPG